MKEFGREEQYSKLLERIAKKTEEQHSRMALDNII